MNIKIMTISAAILTAAVSAAPVHAGVGAADQYAQAKKGASSGQEDFAFMHYRNILRDYPESKYKKPALLGIGEYFFNLEDYGRALEPLQKYNAAYLEDPQSLFAQAILMKLAGATGDKKMAEEQRKKIVAFKAAFPKMKNKKKLRFRSPLYHQFEARFLPEQTEFYRDGELFLTVPL